MLDHLLSYFSRHGSALPPPPKSQRVKRRYEGASVSRLFNDFMASSLSADSEIHKSLRVLRNRCRDQSRNNDYARRYLNILKSNVIGPKGVRIQVRGRNDDGRLDIPGNRIIEEAWQQWARRGVCTVDGRRSWVDCQQLFIESMARDGEVLIQIVRNADNPFGFALHFLEPDYLDEELNEKLDNGRFIRMGVEMDQRLRPIAYHLFQRHPGEQLSRTQNAQRRHARVPASRILHAYLQERPEQTRGVPWMATALGRLKMLNGYEEAELVAARVAASKMGFFVSPDSEGYYGEDLEDDYTPIMSAEPGTFEQLPAGMDFRAYDPEHPTTAFAEFEKAILRGIASGLNVSYCSLANNLEGVNYSSIRQGVMEDRDHFKCLQQLVIDHFIRPVFEEWLTMAMTTGAVRIPITRFEKFAGSTFFRPRGFGWVDPARETRSAVDGLHNGLTTLQDIAADQGRDVEEIFQEQENVRELAQQYGITLAFEPFGEKTQNPRPQGGEDE